jgi:outer membrane protein assembly factor BamB
MRKWVRALVYVLLCVPCSGRIIIVDDDGPADFSDIQAAIDDTNDGDTVYVLPGIYSGAGNHDIDFGGRAITVQSVSPSDAYIVAATIVDCEAAGRGFYFDSGEEANSVVAGLTIVNGYADYGGAVRCDWSSPTISNCAITDSQAQQQGGGVYLYRSEARIIDCTISINSAEIGGGGLCSVERSDLELSGCVFKGNSAGTGGGFYSADYAAFTGTSCTFSGNRADRGGGACCWSSWGQLRNCTFGGNSAVSTGGGLYCQECEPILSHCILWGNTDASGSVQSAQVGGYAPYVEFSCIQDNDPNDSDIPFGGTGQGNIDDDPVFVRAPDDGGDGWGVGGNDDFGDLHLEDGSPCINGGDPNLWIEPGSTDIDGQPRIMGAAVDIGSDEFLIPTTMVTRPEGGETWAAGSTHEILWYSACCQGAAEVLFSADGGENWEVIESVIVEAGSYMWHLSEGVDSNLCLVAVVPNAADPNAVIIESGVFSVKPYSAGPAAESVWKTLGGDFGRQGLSENDGPEVGCIKWEFEVDGAISGSVTVGPNDNVYIPCEDGNLYCLDSNGVLLWTYEANTPLVSSATLGPDGTAYVGGSDKKMYAVDVNGSLRWTHTTGGFVYSSPAAGPDGKVFVGSADGKVYGLGPDGSELWRFETGGFGVIGGSVLASPSIGLDGTVYVSGLYDSNLYALEPNEGTVKWVCHFDSGGWCFSSPVIAADGTIYQTLLYDPNLYAIKPNGGNIVWQSPLSQVEAYDKWYYSQWFEPYMYGQVEHPFFIYRVTGTCAYGYREFEPGDPPKYDLGESGWSEPVVGPDGTIYVSLEDPWLRVVEPNGAMKWATELASTGGFSLTVDSDGWIYAAGDSNLYVLDAQGQEIGRFESGDHQVQLPVVAATNTVVVGDSKDGRFVAGYERNRIWAISGEGCESKPEILYWQGGLEDLNDDGVADWRDIEMMAADWLRCTDCANAGCFDRSVEEPYRGDLNGDGYIDFVDFAILAQRWLAGN